MQLHIPQGENSHLYRYEKSLPDNTTLTDIHAPGGIRTQASAGERCQIYALDRAATGIGKVCVHMCNATYVCVCVFVHLGRSQ